MPAPTGGTTPRPIGAVLAALQDRLDALPPGHPPQHHFLAAYRRTTLAWRLRSAMASSRIPAG